MEHWLPLLEERMVTLFDHLAPGDLVVIDAAAPRPPKRALPTLPTIDRPAPTAPPASPALSPAPRTRS
jgi:hypothetical protein